MLKKSISAIALFSASLSVHAVSYNGYTLNEETNIVSNGSLEWLQWDVTTDMSVASATAAYSTSGWRLAVKEEVVGLFVDFFNGALLNPDEEERFPSYGDNYVDSNTAASFTKLFGVTSESQSYYYDEFGRTEQGEEDYASSAFYGEEGDMATISYQLFVPENVPTLGLAALGSSYYSDNYGVALVRDAAPVPIPTASWLFLSSLGVIAGLNRQKRKRT